jgi:hypothetical protein
MARHNLRAGRHEDEAHLPSWLFCPGHASGAADAAHPQPHAVQMQPCRQMLPHSQASPSQETGRPRGKVPRRLSSQLCSLCSILDGIRLVLFLSETDKAFDEQAVSRAQIPVGWSAQRDSSSGRGAARHRLPAARATSSGRSPLWHVVPLVRDVEGGEA